MGCYAWLSAWQKTSAALWPTALCPAAHAVSPLNLYLLRNVCLLPLCCSVYTAHPGVRSIQSWTTSLILARVSWSGTFSSSHDLPAWDSKSKALLALRTYLLYMPQYLQALPRNTAVSGAGCLVVELSTTKQCFLKLSTPQIVQLRWCGWDEQTWAASCVCSKVPLGLKKLWVWREDQGEEVFCFVFFF